MLRHAWLTSAVAAAAAAAAAAARRRCPSRTKRTLKVPISRSPPLRWRRRRCHPLCTRRRQVHDQDGRQAKVLRLLRDQGFKNITVSADKVLGDSLSMIHATR